MGICVFYIYAPDTGSRDYITFGVHALKSSKYRDHLKALSLTRNVVKQSYNLLGPNVSEFSIESSFVNWMVDVFNAGSSEPYLIDHLARC